MQTDHSFIKELSSIQICNQHLLLLPEKAIFWIEKSYLILTDLHLGKAGHFRKAGIPIPTSIHEADLQNFQHLIDTYQPESILMLGDLFHSEINLEWNAFRLFLEKNADYQFILIKGNHDILPQAAYQENNLKVFEDHLKCAPFYFCHHPLEETHSEYYYMAGHIHPGYRIKGKAAQNIKLPCFFFAEEGALLPAFGKFTGCVHIPKKSNDQVYVIVPTKDNTEKVLRV